MKRKVLYLVGLFIVMFLLGLFREFTFLNLNFQLQYLYYDTPYYRVHAFFHFLNDFEYLTLYNSKWVLTILFTLCFMALSLLIIKSAFGQKRLLRITLISYGVVFLLAGGAYGLGLLLGSRETGYIVARFLMGLLQSPIPAMVLLLAFKLQQKTQP